MNPYLSGIMALSQLSPEQFDMGMQRFQQIQGMQPQGLSALQARQSGLTANMAGGNMAGGQSQLGQMPANYTPSPSGPKIPAGFTSNVSTGNSSYYQNPQTGESFTMFHPLNGAPASMGEIQPAPEGFQPPPPQPLNERQIRLRNGITQWPSLLGQAIPNYSMRMPEQQIGQVYTGEVKDSSGNVVRPALSPRDFQPTSDVFPTQYSQPTMSPFSNVQGSFGTGAMPYTQPYYQRSFNPYAGGYGMGFGGGMPSYGGFGGGKGGGQPMYGGSGGGKGGRR
jgi:hypothetical protein